MEIDSVAPLTLEQIAEKTKVPIEEVREGLKELEEEGLAICTVDEVSGVTMWFASAVLEDEEPNA
jgi:predicted ArsR family transcriptional regulator